MSNLLKLINNWFSVLNAQRKFGKHNGGLHAYGVDTIKIKFSTKQVTLSTIIHIIKNKIG